MPEGPSVKVSDVSGVGEVAKTVIGPVMGGMGALLSRICLPAAEAYGVHLGAKVKAWSDRNLTSIAAVTEGRLSSTGAAEGVSAHPRVVARVLSEGAWVDDPALQEMWGGLLASACTEDGLDDSNVLFEDLLSGLTGLQARILRFACEGAQKFVTTDGFVLAEPFNVRVSELFEAGGVSDIDRLDWELDRLVAVGLLAENQGFQAGPVWKPSEGVLPSHVGLKPSALALHMYVRCQGSREPPVKFFGITDRREGVAMRGFSAEGAMMFRPAGGPGTGGA